ncbi:MAG: 30S ribosomal protein S1 [Planctomycetes bacterium]|nr:30S ribosomal protein S1 [Planctomycetota bacterium]
MAENLFLKNMGILDKNIEKEVSGLMKSYSAEELSKLYKESIREFKPHTIVKGKVILVQDKQAVVDIGYKSEGLIPLQEFEKPAEVKPGDELEVYLETVEDESDLIVLSKSKADYIRGWERIMQAYKEGDPVKGTVTRKVKGGLIVNIGGPAFLPASQVDIRRLDDIGKLVGKEIEAKIIKLDSERMSIIISRRKYMEELRSAQREKLLKELKEGDVREGIVKNIADYGVFVDLGGIDGLLHITDMAWRRVSHPSEIVTMDQKIQIKILKIDTTTNRITVGFKQLTPNPWEKVEQKYPANTRVKGKVVNIMPYGAFVELESGVEGLLHISEMSWTKRISHPSDMLAIGDIIEAMVLKISSEKQELLLGMKQLEVNPWTTIEGKYPPGTRIQGRVRNLTTYGAFIEIEEGIDGLLHLSDISWTKKIVKPADVIKKGDKIEAMVLSVDPEKKRVSLGLKQLTANPWETTIPEKYNVGAVVPGKVLRLTKDGAVIELAPDIEGFLKLVKEPESAGAEGTPKEEGEKVHLKIDDAVTVEVTKIDPAEGKIMLKMGSQPS